MTSFELIQQKCEQSRHLLKKLNHEIPHAIHVTSLSLSLFDQLKPVHKLGLEERTWLECAAYLHDVGWVISGPKHHKHSLRIILNADLPALDEREKRILGNIARYHRRALPEPSHAQLMLLSPQDQTVVRKTAALLRIADGLDTSHESRIQKLECLQANGECTFRAYSDVPCIEELNAVDRKKDLFIQEFGRDFRVVFHDANTDIRYLEAVE